MRWFFTQLPLRIDRHFQTDTELQERTDWYAVPVNPACGIKVREGKLETKLRCAELGPRQFSLLHGRLESYKKWSLEFTHEEPPSVEELAGTGWLDVDKVRRLRRFEVQGDSVTPVAVRPANGCEFELTQLTVSNRVYWTVGFEAVGGPLEQETNLEKVATAVCDQGGMLLPFSLENSFGYAHWLANLSQWAKD